MASRTCSPVFSRTNSVGPAWLSRASSRCRFSNTFSPRTDTTIEQTDIVMLLTPRIIRTHEYTARDLSPIYVGTNQNFGLTGPPPLIAAPPAEPETAPAPGAAAPAPGVPPQGLPVPTVPQGGTPGLVTTPAPQRRSSHRPGCTARRSAGATRPDGADDDHTRAVRANLRNRAGRRSTCRRRPVHGA